MIYKIYTFRYEANKFLYGLGKGHQQYTIVLLVGVKEVSQGMSTLSLPVSPVFCPHWPGHVSWDTVCGYGTFNRLMKL